MSFFINHQLPFVMNHSASLERREYFRVYQTRAISVFRVKFNVEFTRLAVNFSWIFCQFVFFSKLFLVLWVWGVSLKFSKNLNLNLKFGRHSFSVHFIFSVHFQGDIFRSTSCILIFTIATIFAHDPRQQYPFVHKCNSTLNALSSIANQTASLPLAMRF